MTHAMASRPKRARPPPPPPAKLPQLSCELCHERKVKCDKQQPCTNCHHAGVDCTPVHRKRLPRGRHVRNASTERDLRARVQRLEALITGPEANGGAPMPEASTSSPDAVRCLYRYGRDSLILDGIQD